MMNRLPTLPKPSIAKLNDYARQSHDVAGPWESLDRHLLEQTPLAWRLLGPVHYEPNYAYPLLVWLHSAGDDENQLRRVMPHVSLRNYVSVAPRGVVTEECGYSYRWSEAIASPDRAWHAVQQAIEAARKQYNVHPERVFLAGLHDGGAMAMRLALLQPERFAGAISIGGPFPMNCSALNRLACVRDLPLLIARGMESVGYPESRMCEELRLFHAARMRVHLRQYLCGDELTVPMLRDMDAWLMEQVTGTPVLQSNDQYVNDQ
jgi:phospholipase/carboxylesterase